MLYSCILYGIKLIELTIELNPLVTDGSPSQMASNAENVSLLWRHHVLIQWPCWFFHSLLAQR